MEWLTEHKIPLGKWISDGVDLLLDHGAWIFDSFSDGLAFLINALVDLMLWCPPLLLVVIFAGLAYALHRSWKLSLLILVGVPLGIIAAHRQGFYTLLRPILDLMQTIPTFVYLIPTMIMFGLGVVPGLISTVIFAIPAPIRLTYLGISNVPKSLIEAGEAFGATKRQILWKIELPHAAPTIMAGVTQCIMLCLSMVVIAAMVGAPGLGVPVLRALNTVNIAKGFEAGLAIVIIAILLDRVCKQPSKTEKK